MANYIKITSVEDAKRVHKKIKELGSIVISSYSKERIVSDSEATFLKAFENNRKSISTFIVKYYSLKDGIYRYGSPNTFTEDTSGAVEASSFLKQA